MAGRVVPLSTSEQTVAAAAAAFLAQPGRARSTGRSYSQTLTRLVHELGGQRPLSTLTVEAVTVAMTTAWGGRAPATWNRPMWLPSGLPGVLPATPLAGRGPHRGPRAAAGAS
jgi:hypothetical protein